MAAQFEGLTVEVRTKDSKKGPVSQEEMKEMLGWMEEREGDEWGQEYAFKDVNGKKVRLKHNDTNRPLRRTLALRYANDMLRGEWKVNGETMIRDRHGKFQSGQHRAIGFIFACQLHVKDRSKWKEYVGTKEPVFEGIFVCGISEKKEIADTLDIGQKRSLGDVLFRNRTFGNVKEKEQQVLANALAGAARLVWLRTGGQTVSDAPHFPHSEALNFLKQHETIQEEVNYLITEEGGRGAEGKRISRYVSIPYAAAFCYLMGTCKTNPEKFVEQGSPALDFKFRERARKFWALFAAGTGFEKGDSILVLRETLVNLTKSGSADRDLVCGLIASAWNHWVDGKKATAKELMPSRRKNDLGKMVIVDMPRVGGLDVAVVDTSVPNEEGEDKATVVEKKSTKGEPPIAAKKKKAVKKSDGPDVGEWVWVTSEDGDPWRGQIETVEGETAHVRAEADSELYEVDLEATSPDRPE